jgi:hypothetical protein
MHRWRFQELMRWLLPALALAGTWCVLLSHQRRIGLGLEFPSDEAYAGLAVARTLAESRTHGLAADHPAPVMRNALWRLVLASGARMSGGVVAAAYLANLLAGVVLLWLILRVARWMFPFPPFMAFAGLLWVATPGMATRALDGGPEILASMLVVAAVLRHVGAQFRHRRSLSLSAALLVGLLMWIRLEFVMLWVVFILHGAVAALLGRLGRRGRSDVGVRGLNGLLLILLVVFPLVAWNVRAIGVPWPRPPGAPLSLDAWGVSAGGALKAWAEQSKQALAGVGEIVARNPWMAETWSAALVLAGLGLALALFLVPSEPPVLGVLPLVVLLLPVLGCGMAPYLGPEGGGMVAIAVTPLCCLAAAYVVFRTPFLIESAVRRRRKGLPETSIFGVIWAVVGAAALVASGLRAVRAAGGRLEDLAQQEDGRRVVREHAAGDTGLIATDRPGWLRYALGAPVMDLSGEFEPRVLAVLDAAGGLSQEKAGALLDEFHPQRLVLWESRHAGLADGAGAEQVTQGDSWPRVYRLPVPGGP